MFILEFMGLWASSLLFYRNTYFLKIDQWQTTNGEQLILSVFVPVIFWKQKVENVLCAYDTKAISQLISPAVEQIANLVVKLLVYSLID